MNIFRYEFKRYLLSSLIWAFSLSVFGVICIQLFVAFTQDLTVFEQMLSAYSPEMLKALGAEISTIKTLTGFYSFCFMYMAVAAAFQAMYMGIHIVGKEFSGKTADFLYTKPVKRQSILAYKLLSVVCCLMIVNVIYSVGTYMSAVSTGISFDTTLFFTINFSMFLTQLLFLSVGFLLGCIIKKIKYPLSFVTGIISIFFLLQMIVNLEPDGVLSYFSFLNYVAADTIMLHSGFEMMRLGVLLVLIFGFLGAGFSYFMNRDIHTV